MSLLLDALKRAEQEKLARQGHEAPDAGHATPETAHAGAAPARRKLELELHDHAPAAAAAAHSSPAAAAVASTPAPASARDREGAKAVFAAKQTDPAPAPGSGRKKAILAIVIGALVVFAAGGGYVWYEINKSSPQMARAPLPVTPRPITTLGAPAVNPTATPPAAPAGATTASGATPAPDAGAAAKRDEAVPPVAVLKPESLANAPARTRPEPKAAERLVMNLLNDRAGAKSAPPLKLSRTIDAPRVAPEVGLGYDALKRGDAAGALKHYEAAVSADPTSVDAQLGLATAAARTGDRATATRHYRRTLALDPKNPSAVAGLASLADFSRPEVLEQQLRADITRYPQSPALHYTLGNLYASQARWTEAQSAYFEAYRLDPESADLAYNLAVSLDHLGQGRVAADFYQRALVASRQQAAQFDKGQVSRRIAELKP